jgi:hypothetical protein
MSGPGRLVAQVNAAPGHFLWVMEEREWQMRKRDVFFKACGIMLLAGTLPLLAGSATNTSDAVVYDLSPSYLAVGLSVTPVGITNAVQVATNNSGAGGTSLQLGGEGLLNHGQMAGIEWSVIGSGVLAFDWRVRSELNYDWLSFYQVGSGPTNRISGTASEWARVSVTVTGATNENHTFRWEYAKDQSDSISPDCGWIDAISWAPFYTLTVAAGTGDGDYTNGSPVAIIADAPPAYFTFDRWTGDTNSIANVAASNTTLTMPATSVSVTATYVSMLHNLTVVNGSGGGTRLGGATVSVTADPDPLYQEFAGWTGGDAGLLANASARITTLTMPMRDASLVATYSASVARVAGCYGRTFTNTGTAGGVSTDATAGSPSGTPAVMLGGSGIIPDNGFAAFQTVVSGSGTVTFWWKVSSEDNGDYLKFLVDGVVITNISGTQGVWGQASNRVEGAGSHILRWEYAKNGLSASSTDAGWVDDIIWTGDSPAPVITPDVHAVAATNGLFTVRFLGERGIPYTIYSNATLESSGWAPMAVVPQEMGETNGLFRFEATLVPDVGQPHCFYRMGGGM